MLGLILATIVLTGYNLTSYTIWCLLISSQGKHLFLAGVKHVSSRAIEDAIKMKRTGREARRLRALASAWQIKEAEHYSKLVRLIHEEDHANFCDYFEDQEVDLKEEVDNAADLVAYNRELYNEQLESIRVIDTQLDWLEEVMRNRIDETDRDSDDSESSLSSVATEPG